MKLKIWNPIGLLAPDECLTCGEPQSAPACSACLSDLYAILNQGCRFCGNPEVSNDALDCSWCRRLRRKPEGIGSYFIYRYKGRELFHQAKFGGYWRLLNQIIAMAMSQGRPAFLDQAQDGMTIVPIPDRWTSRLKRTVHPTDVLAKTLAGTWRLPFRASLAMKWFGHRQVGLDLDARRHNMSGRFHWKKRGGSVPSQVLLVDDVLTTGGTMEAATVALRQAGVKQVYWISLFRTAR